MIDYKSKTMDKQYHYEFKHGQHSVILVNYNPIEYLGIKAVADSKKEAEDICLNLNLKIQTEKLNNQTKDNGNNNI